MRVSGLGKGGNVGLRGVKREQQVAERPVFFYLKDAFEVAEGESPVDLYLRSSPRERRVEFLDTANVARFFGVSQRTVQYWIHLGKLPAVRVGRTYRVARSHLRRILEADLD